MSVYERMSNEELRDEVRRRGHVKTMFRPQMLEILIGDRTCGALCKTHAMPCKKGSCPYHKKFSAEDRLKVTYIRHGFSCANAITYYGKFYDQVKRLFYRDPPLNDLGLAQADEEAKRTNAVVFASTMIRAQETALHLFPYCKVIVVPYMKELGWTAENSLKESPAEQRRYFGKQMAQRLDYRFVTQKDGSWTKEAYKSDYAGFLSWLDAYVRGHCSDVPEVVLVTHSSLMRKQVFKTKDKPKNLGAYVKEYGFKASGGLHDISSSIGSFAADSKAKMFGGVKLPKNISSKDVVRCDYRPSSIPATTNSKGPAKAAVSV